MKIDIPQKKKLVYEMSIPIRWGDMDAFQHLNNTAYFRYLETIRIDWLHSLGHVLRPGPGAAAPGGALKSVSDPDRHEGIVILNAFCNFYRQLDYPGNVLVKMYVSDVGRSTFESWATMERADDPGLIYADGGATAVWVDLASQKSAPLPDWLRAVLE